MSSLDYLIQLFTSENEQEYAKNMFIAQRLCPFIKYDKDMLTAKYTGNIDDDDNTFSIQTNKKINKETLIFYYEIKINDIGHGKICLGLAEEGFPFNKQPGLTKKCGRSFGYYAEGGLFYNKNQLNYMVPPYTTGDIVGCGINLVKSELFFTHNGTYFGNVFDDFDLREYYPIVSLKTENESITFNFGMEKFKFPLEQLLHQQKQEIAQNVLNISIDPIDTLQTIKNYLIQSGYLGTLESFVKYSKLGENQHEKQQFIEKKDQQLEYQKMNLWTKTKQILSLVFPMLNNKKKDDKIEEEQNPNSSFNQNSNHNHNTNSNNSQLILNLDKIIENGHSVNSTMNLKIDEESQSLSDFICKKRQDLIKQILDDFLQNHEENLQFKNTNLENQPEESHNGTIIVNGQLNLNQYEEIYLLETRARIIHYLISGSVYNTIRFIQKKFPNLLEFNDRITFNLLALQFIFYVRKREYIKAIEYAQLFLNSHREEKIDLINDNGFVETKKIDDVLGLLCYQDVNDSIYKNVASALQTDLVAQLINEAILENLGFVSRTNLNSDISQLLLIQDYIKQINKGYGCIFSFNPKKI